MNKNYENDALKAGAKSRQEPETSDLHGKMLIAAWEAARLCEVSESSWWAHNAAGRCPAPVYIGGSTRWRVGDVTRWIDAGCPSREQFEAAERGAR